MAKRIVQLDGIRAIAVTAVFINHMFRAKMLWMGVDLFFVLSGFLITGILIDQRKQTLRGYLGYFYGRRVRRILPPYLLLLCIGLIVYGTWWLHWWYLYLFLMNLMLAMPVAIPGAFTLLWSLAVEEQFYLVWPFAVYFLSERVLLRLALALTVAAPALRWICTPWFDSHFAIYALTPFRMDTLAAGAVIAIMWRRHRDKIERWGLYGLMLSAIALVALPVASWKFKFSTYAPTRTANVWIYELSLLACVGIVLWALGGRGVRLLTLPPLVYLGRISYSVYLIHVVAILEVEKYIHRPAGAALLAAGLTLVYATLSWYLLESPILERRPTPLGNCVRRLAGNPG